MSASYDRLVRIAPSRWLRRWYRILSGCVVLVLCAPQVLSQDSEKVAPQGNSGSETIVVDPSAPAHPFPHYWEEMFGSGRAILSLRESYRRDLRDVKQATNFN